MFRRTTKDIVVPRSRLREELEGAHKPENPAEPKNTDLEERNMKKDWTEKWMPKLNWFLGGMMAGCVLILVLCLVLLERPPKIPERQFLAALEAPELAGAVMKEDVLQLYDAEGAVIPELRYVQVKYAAHDSILLALDAGQMAAFSRQSDDVTAALAAHSGERAESLLEEQRRLLRPEVQLSLPETLVMSPGDALEPELEITLNPVEAIRPEVFWSSSDEAVCAVVDGVLTAGETGQAVITVSCGGAEVSRTVTVAVDLEEIQLSQSSLTLAIGETAELAAAPAPENATGFSVEWHSDNPAVVSVEGGAVTAVSPGTATITARCGDITASCAVAVGVRTELVQLVQHAVSLAVGETAVLEYAVYPAENNIDAGSWTSDNPDVVTVAEDGTVTAAAPGTAVITITHGGAADTCTITVK